MNSTRSEFGWVVKSVSSGFDGSEGIRLSVFVLLSPLSPDLFGGCGEVQSDRTCAVWRVLGGGVGPGVHAPDHTSQQLFARMELLEGLPDVEEGDVLRPTSTPILPGKYFEEVKDERRRDGGPPVTVVVGKIEIVNGKVSYSSLASDEHVDLKFSGDGVPSVGVVPSVVQELLRSERLRAAVFLRESVSPTTFDRLRKAVPYREDHGEVDQALIQGALFVGLRYQAELLLQRLTMMQMRAALCMFD